MIAYLPQLSPGLTNSLIHRYFTNHVVFNKTVSVDNFATCVHTFCSKSNNKQENLEVLTPHQLQWACQKFPYDTAVVLRSIDIPTTCCFWSFYGFSPDPILTNFDEKHWYEDNGMTQNCVFLFLHTNANNEFWSLERQIIKQCQNGSVFWVLSSFKPPQTYTSPQDILVKCNFFNCVKLWVWKFSKIPANLPKLSTPFYLNQRRIPPFSTWAKLQPLQPLFQEELWILTCPTRSLSPQDSDIFDKWRKLDTLSFLLGFFDTDVLSQLQCSCPKLKVRHQIQIRAWRFLRAIYYRRHQRYKKLKEWKSES